MPSRDGKLLQLRVGRREHALAHWYAATVAERPVSDLLREMGVDALLALAEAALASGAFGVPEGFGKTTAMPERRQVA